MTSKHPILAYRIKHDLSRQALGDRIGVSRQTVRRWEEEIREIDLDLLPTVVSVTGIPARVLRPDLAKLFEEAGP